MITAPANAYYTPRVSPAGDRVVLSVDSDRGQDVYVYDIPREALTRLTFNGEDNLWPAWTPDGEHIVFTSRNEPFPRSSGGRWQVTTEREIGIPRWATTAPELRLPRALPRDSVIIDYEVDGERFIAGNHRTAPGSAGHVGAHWIRDVRSRAGRETGPDSNECPPAKR